MITCKHLIDTLDEYLSGTLPEAARSSLDQHFAACPPCRAYVDQYRKTVEALKAARTSVEMTGAGALTLPPELVKAILAAREAGGQSGPASKNSDS